MSDNNLNNHTKDSKRFFRNPLASFALLIMLVYSFAVLTFILGGQNLIGTNKSLLIWFLILFPVLVLGVFTWLLTSSSQKLYAPGDFVNQEDYLKLLEQVHQRKENDISNTAVTNPNDPQKGRWGGQRERDYRVVSASAIRPLSSDTSFFQIPLKVCSTDPVKHPLTGKVTFYLHDSFSHNVVEVYAKNGVAQLSLVAYGAFTVGVETEDGTKLEIDLADPDIDAPAKFKEA